MVEPAAEDEQDHDRNHDDPTEYADLAEPHRQRRFGIGETSAIALGRAGGDFGEIFGSAGSLAHNTPSPSPPSSRIN